MGTSTAGTGGDGGGGSGGGSGASASGGLRPPPHACDPYAQSSTSTLVGSV